MYRDLSFWWHTLPLLHTYISNLFPEEQNYEHTKSTAKVEGKDLTHIGGWPLLEVCVCGRGQGWQDGYTCHRVFPVSVWEMHNSTTTQHHLEAWSNRLLFPVGRSCLRQPRKHCVLHGEVGRGVSNTYTLCILKFQPNVDGAKDCDSYKNAAFYKVHTS